MKIGGIPNPDGGLSFIENPVAESLIEGSVRVQDGQIVSGELNLDLQQLCEHAAELLDSKGLQQLADLLETKNIDGLQVFWGEKMMGGQVTINGIDLQLKKQTFDVEGSQHSSTFEYDDQGNVSHYFGATEVNSGTVTSFEFMRALLCACFLLQFDGPSGGMHRYWKTVNYVCFTEIIQIYPKLK